MQNKRCFIIGNGASRRDFDLHQLDNEITFGCNALYRDYNPTFLVAIDSKMINEITKNVLSDINVIIPPIDEQYEPIEFNPRRPRSCAGMNAMIEAIRRGYKELFCMGFDFLVVDQKNAQSNMYEGTECYGPETKTSYNDGLNRLRYLEWFCAQHKENHFHFIFENGVKKIHSMEGDNISGMYYHQLKL